jgi:hypothetical protein
MLAHTRRPVMFHLCGVHPRLAIIKTRTTAPPMSKIGNSPLSWEVKAAAFGTPPVVTEVPYGEVT